MCGCCVIKLPSSSECCEGLGQGKEREFTIKVKIQCCADSEADTESTEKGKDAK